MNLPLRKEPWPPGENGWQTCPVCKQKWRPWAGSRLPCHARCLFTEEEKQQIRGDARTQTQIAKDYGVTDSVIRSILCCKATHTKPEL